MPFKDCNLIPPSAPPVAGAKSSFPLHHLQHVWIKSPSKCFILSVSLSVSVHFTTRAPVLHHHKPRVAAADSPWINDYSSASNGNHNPRNNRRRPRQCS